MQGGEWVRWTAGDIEIHRNDAVQITDNFLTAVKRAAGNSAGTTGNDDLGAGNCLKGGDGSGSHIL